MPIICAYEKKTARKKRQIKLCYKFNKKKNVSLTALRIIKKGFFIHKMLCVIMKIMLRIVMLRASVADNDAFNNGFISISINYLYLKVCLYSVQLASSIIALTAKIFFL